VISRKRSRLVILLAIALLSSCAATVNFSDAAQAKSATWEIPSTQFAHDTAGFATPFSTTPGTSINLYITCNSPTFNLTVYRMGYYDGAGAQLALTTPEQPCLHQDKKIADAKTNFVAEDWKVTTVLATDSLMPGMYLARINASNGHQSFIPFVLKDKDVVGRVVVSIPFQTSLSYNAYTGASAYGEKGDFERRARVLSFNTPFSEGYGAGIYYFYVQPVVKLIDQLHLDPSFVTDVDISQNPQIISGAKVLVSGGHDEYWTLQERDAVMNERSKGMNLLFFGANVEYWRVRLHQGSQLNDLEMDIYKSQSEDQNTAEPTIKFRDQKLPESELTYQDYNCFPAHGDFQVSNPGAFIFDGTGVKKGDRFPGMMGPEVDHSLATDTFTGTRSILNTSIITCGTSLLPKPTSSTIVYGAIAGAGGTVSIGDMNWVERGLTTDVPKRTFAFTTQVTTNILEAAAKGPMGLQDLKTS